MLRSLSNKSRLDKTLPIILPLSNFEISMIIGGFSEITWIP